MYTQNEEQHMLLTIYTLCMSSAQSLTGTVFSKLSCLDAFDDALSK